MVHLCSSSTGRRYLINCRKERSDPYQRWNFLFCTGPAVKFRILSLEFILRRPSLCSRLLVESHILHPEVFSDVYNIEPQLFCRFNIVDVIVEEQCFGGFDLCFP
jgi:hypothetical protein